MGRKFLETKIGRKNKIRKFSLKIFKLSQFFRIYQEKWIRFYRL